MQNQRAWLGGIWPSQRALKQHHTTPFAACTHASARRFILRLQMTHQGCMSPGRRLVPSECGPTGKQVTAPGLHTSKAAVCTCIQLAIPAECSRPATLQGVQLPDMLDLAVTGMHAASRRSQNPHQAACLPETCAALHFDSPPPDSAHAFNRSCRSEVSWWADRRQGRPTSKGLQWPWSGNALKAAVGYSFLLSVSSPSLPCNRDAPLYQSCWN